jgi:phosphatidate cytidylyltransferase
MSETIKRIISGISLGILYLVFITVNLYFHIAIFVILAFFTMLILNEYINLNDRDEEGRPFASVVYICSFFIMLSFYIKLVISDADILIGKGQSIYSVFGIDINILRTYDNSGDLIFGFIFIFLLIIFGLQLFTRPLMGAIFSIGATIFGIFYIGFLASHLLLLLTLQGGVFLVWYVSVINIMTDTAAYFGGKIMGNHPVGFRVSPNKTYEGYICGLVVSSIFGVLVFLTFDYIFKGQLPLKLGEAIILAPIISLLAVLGDLIESGIKRDAHKKDSAQTIPGHGGILDIVDSLLITVPAIYYYFIFRESVLKIFL